MAMNLTPSKALHLGSNLSNMTSPSSLQRKAESKPQGPGFWNHHSYFLSLFPPLNRISLGFNFSMGTLQLLIKKKGNIAISILIFNALILGLGSCPTKRSFSIAGKRWKGLEFVAQTYDVFEISAWRTWEFGAFNSFLCFHLVTHLKLYLFHL